MIPVAKVEFVLTWYCVKQQFAKQYVIVTYKSFINFVVPSYTRVAAYSIKLVYSKNFWN